MAALPAAQPAKPQLMECALDLTHATQALTSTQLLASAYPASSHAQHALVLPAFAQAVLLVLLKMDNARIPTILLIQLLLLLSEEAASLATKSKSLSI